MAVYLDVVSSGHREHDVDGDGWLGERTSTAIIVRGCSRLFEVVRGCAGLSGRWLRMGSDPVVGLAAAIQALREQLAEARRAGWYEELGFQVEPDDPSGRQQGR